MENGIYRIIGLDDSGDGPSAMVEITPVDYLPGAPTIKFPLSKVHVENWGTQVNHYLCMHKDGKFFLTFTRKSYGEAMSQYQAFLNVFKGEENVSKEEDVMINLIYASDEAGGIGKNNTIPWRSKADMNWFKTITTGYPIVMGRKTWESLNGRMLPNRPHFVVSTTGEYNYPKHVDFYRCFNTESAIAAAKRKAVETGVNQIFIIGGATIYEETLPIVDRIYHTRVSGVYDCDTFFKPSLEGFEPVKFEHSFVGLETSEPNITVTSACRIQSIFKFI
jgi:dihydrofolate reductase